MNSWLKEHEPPSLVETQTLGGTASTLRDYGRILIQRRWIVVASVIVGMALATLYVLLATPTYQATTTLQIDRQGPDILTFKDVNGVDPAYGAYQDFYQTQYKILQSRAVARMAIEEIDLIRLPEYVNRKPPAARRLIYWAKSKLLGLEESDDELEPALKFVAEGLSVHPVRDSQLVKVRFTDRDPQLAHDLAEAIARSYLEFNLESRYGTTGMAREFLTKEVGRVRLEIDDLERQLQEISSTKELYATSDGVQDISGQALATLHAQYTDAKGELAAARARHEAILSTPPGALPEVLASELIRRLRENYAELERAYSQDAERFMADWPPLVRQRQELEQARDRLQIEMDTLADQVIRISEADLIRARAEVRNLGKQVDTQKVEVQRVNRDAVAFASLRAAIETKREVLAGLVARQSETETSERLKDTRASNIRVVDAAELPRKPIGPKKLVNLIFGLLLGGALGVGGVFLLDYLDNTVKHEDDVKRISGLPALGYVPFHSSLAARADAGASPPASRPTVDLESYLTPRSQFAESFKTLRTAILLASADHAPRTFVVSSCEPSDGKSTVALNLAIALTQLGRRVLLVDADLRRPRVHHALGISSKVGLSSMLSGNATADKAIQETMVPDLHVIASGPIPPNPSELLGSKKLEKFLDPLDVTRGYDHVVFDSPPLLSVSDPLILAARAEAMILVVRAGKTARESLAHATARLRQAHVRVLGVVLNAVQRQSEYYYYGREDEKIAGETTVEESVSA